MEGYDKRRGVATLSLIESCYDAVALKREEEWYYYAVMGFCVPAEGEVFLTVKRTAVKLVKKVKRCVEVSPST